MPANSRHHLHHSGWRHARHRRGRPENLDRVGALYARERLVDVVLDILRIAETYARKVRAAASRRSRSPVRAWSVRAAIASSGFRSTLNSTLKKPVVSVPSSGRPSLRDHLADFGKRHEAAAHPATSISRRDPARSSAASSRAPRYCPLRAWAEIRRPAAETATARRPPALRSRQRHPRPLSTRTNRPMVEAANPLPYEIAATP